MTQTTIHRVVVVRHGGPEVLEYVEHPLPEPEPGEVRVNVMAAGVSGFDLMYRKARWLPGMPRRPFALGEDVVGTVDRPGPGVIGLELGQMVAGTTLALGLGGGYTESLCLPASDLVPVPPGLDAAEAVCLVVNYLTAHLHLHQYGEAQRGERVLVHGAAGGVGTALLDLARSAGLEAYGTATGAGLEVVAAFGATPIDYRREDFAQRIRALTGDGVDLVVDPLGGGPHLWRSYRALREGGRLVWLGSSATKDRGFLRVAVPSLVLQLLLRFVPDGKRVPSTPDLGAFTQRHRDWYRDTLAELLALGAAGELTPVVAARIPLAEAARAHELLERGGHIGKVVLVTDHSDVPA